MQIQEKLGSFKIEIIFFSYHDVIIAYLNSNNCMKLSEYVKKSIITPKRQM